MPNKPQLPKYVSDAFHDLQTTLGGDFKRQPHLDLRIFKSLVYAMDRPSDDGTHLIRIMLLAPDHFILRHFHKKVTEVFEIVQFLTEPENQIKGHLFYPGPNRQPVENLLKQKITFKPLEPHGLHFSGGHLLVVLRIYGKYDVADTHCVSGAH